MSRDSRLSVTLHLLLHMENEDGAVTSEALGPLARTNPVVVRRIMGKLREAGLVTAAKGHGGGWALARPLEKITLGDVYAALDISLFGIARPEASPRCLLERAANGAVADALDEAERLMTKALARVSLRDLITTATHMPGGHKLTNKGASHVQS